MKKVLIYNDQGVSNESLQETITVFNHLQYPVEVVSADLINNQSWESTAFLLIIPGGRADPYYELLYPRGHQKILNFVARGGNYLGICAGGYYGASQIVFEKGHPEHQIITNRTLGLYRGTAEGPAYELGVFRYQSEAGARVASIMSNTISFPAYFNGGCYFYTDEPNDKTTVIARYADIEQQPAAIILCHYEQGCVCLSGVHFEYALNDDYQSYRENFVKTLLSFFTICSENF